MSWLDAINDTQEAVMNTFQERELITYIPAGLDPVQIRGIFDEPKIEQTLLDGVVFDTVGPMVTIKVSELEHEPVIGDRALIRNQYYRVVDRRPDGQGMYALILEMSDAPS